MSFSELVRQGCVAMSAEQAVSLREFIVDLAEKIETEPNILKTGLKSLMRDAEDDGFASDELLATLKQLAEATLPVAAHAHFASHLEAHLERNSTIREFAAVMSTTYSDLVSVLLSLLEKAKAEKVSLTGVAGGTNHKLQVKNSWDYNGWSTATKKQKWRKGGIDALELAIGASAISRIGMVVSDRYEARKLAQGLKTLNVTLPHKIYANEGPLGEGVEGLGKGIKSLAVKDGLLGATKSYDFKTRWGSASHELKKWIPGSPLIRLYQKRRDSGTQPKHIGSQDKRGESIANRTESIGTEARLSDLFEDYDFEPRRSMRILSSDVSSSQLFAMNEPDSDSDSDSKLISHGQEAWRSSLANRFSLVDFEADLAIDGKALKSNLKNQLEAIVKEAAEEVAITDEELVDEV